VAHCQILYWSREICHLLVHFYSGYMQGPGESLGVVTHMIGIPANHDVHLFKYNACRDVSFQRYIWCAPWSYSILVLVILFCSLMVYYDLPSWIVVW
jgi:hypothetical protein